MDILYNYNSRLGEKTITNEGYEIEIIEWFGVRNCTIKFENGVILYNIKYQGFKKKNIVNPYHPSLYGVGYLGIGKHTSKSTHNNMNYYKIWSSMIQRTNSEKRAKVSPTYSKCSVAEEWKCFQIFGDWFVKYHKKDFHLDKDILIKGNKVYSPETCCFVPREINNQFKSYSDKYGELPKGVSFYKITKRFTTQISLYGKRVALGYFNTPDEAFKVYKNTKEKHLKELANKWKDDIEYNVYITILNYTITKK
jgi:hypothetical protein